MLFFSVQLFLFLLLDFSRMGSIEWAA
jgi:hypothetical protein